MRREPQLKGNYPGTRTSTVRSFLFSFFRERRMAERFGVKLKRSATPPEDLAKEKSEAIPEPSIRSLAKPEASVRHASRKASIQGERRRRPSLMNRLSQGALASTVYTVSQAKKIFASRAEGDQLDPANSAFFSYKPRGAAAASSRQSEGEHQAGASSSEPSYTPQRAIIDSMYPSNTRRIGESAPRTREKELKKERPTRASPIKSPSLPRPDVPVATQQPPSGAPSPSSKSLAPQQANTASPSDGGIGDASVIDQLARLQAQLSSLTTQVGPWPHQHLVPDNQATPSTDPSHSNAPLASRRYRLLDRPFAVLSVSHPVVLICRW